MTTNSAPFKVGAEIFKTSYTIFGDLKSGARPLVVLNGGPGIPHSYMLPHANLYKTRGQPVVFYDQLGCGDSTRLRDKHTLGAVDGTPPGTGIDIAPALFVAELDNLLRHLGIAHDFDLLGQSWGVTLAIEYIATHRPAGLKHLVLTSGAASYTLWREALARLRTRWPRDFQDVLCRHERDGTTDTPEYQEALMQFYKKHVLNIVVWPPEALRSMAQMGEDPTVYRAMYARFFLLIYGLFIPPLSRTDLFTFCFRPGPYIYAGSESTSST
jgi:proline-specific peptidase